MFPATSLVTDGVASEAKPELHITLPAALGTSSSFMHGMHSINAHAVDVLKHSLCLGQRVQNEGFLLTLVPDS